MRSYSVGSRRVASRHPRNSVVCPAGFRVDGRQRAVGAREAGIRRNRGFEIPARLVDVIRHQVHGPQVDEQHRARRVHHPRTFQRGDGLRVPAGTRLREAERDKQLQVRGIFPRAKGSSMRPPPRPRRAPSGTRQAAPSSACPAARDRARAGAMQSPRPACRHRAGSGRGSSTRLACRAVRAPVTPRVPVRGTDRRRYTPRRPPEASHRAR